MIASNEVISFSLTLCHQRCLFRKKVIAKMSNNQTNNQTTLSNYTTNLCFAKGMSLTSITMIMIIRIRIQKRKQQTFSLKQVKYKTKKKRKTHFLCFFWEKQFWKKTQNLQGNRFWKRCFFEKDPRNTKNWFASCS